MHTLVRRYIKTSIVFLGGVSLFFVNMWPRIRPLGSRMREANGEKF